MSKKPQNVAQYRAIIHASELYTGAGIATKSGKRVQDPDMGKIEDGALIYSVRKVGKQEVPDRIIWVGETARIPKEFAKAPALHLRGKHCVTAGFVDCHTHLVFAGDRSEEFALRCGGLSYEEIAKRGGGIQTTVRATRSASLQELEKLAITRVLEALRFGTRVIEVKSGYGLDLETEMKQLQVVQRLKRKFPQVKFSTTFLGAHAIPSGERREAYVRAVIDDMLPLVTKEKLADACDVFVDAGYFELEDARKIQAAAKRHGLGFKIHADELGNTESALFAAKAGAWSADHLLCVSDKGIQALAASETVAVLLPTTAFYLKAKHAPGRKLMDAGSCVALATDFNPGTSMTLNLPFAMTLGALYLGMTRAELLAAVTWNAARALRLEKEVGTLEPGKEALFSVHPFRRFEEIYYRFGW
jgi:imidazolonepropionase